VTCIETIARASVVVSKGTIRGVAVVNCERINRAVHRDMAPPIMATVNVTYRPNPGNSLGRKLIRFAHSIDSLEVLFFLYFPADRKSMNFFEESLVGRQIHSVHVDSEVSYIMLSDGTQITIRGWVIVERGPRSNVIEATEVCDRVLGNVPRIVGH
jgi:hypothetical protein